MTDTTNDATALAGLVELVRPPVEFLLTRLQDDLGDNLLSLCVVGSALTDDFHPKFSDINTVVVVGRRSHQLLGQLAACGRPMGKRRLRAPLLMTQEYIQQSLDVFSVEFLDFQLNHAAVYGPDPFAELSFHKRDVRLQCERQFKAALIKLRQGYISALGKPKVVGALLLDCAAELAVLLRAMLWLTDTDRPREALPTLAAAGEKFEFDPAKVTPLLKHRRHRTRPDAGEVDKLFEDIYQVIDHLGRTVDAFSESEDA